MGFFKNPVLEENLQVFAENRRVLRTVLLFGLFAALVLLLSWPRSHIGDYVIRGEIPVTYSVTVLCVYLALAVLNALLGSESIAGENLYSSGD